MIGIIAPISTTNEDFKSISQKNNDYCVFGSTSIPTDIDLNYLQIIRVYDFKGSMICSNIETAQILIDLPLPKKKYFYVKSFEWEQFKLVNYNDLKKIYLNDSIDLIAANEHIYEVLTKLFKEPKAICKDWDFSKLEL
jgi:hypothetical protein